MTDSLVKQYLLEEPNESYRAEIEQLIQKGAQQELADRLGGNLQFGTAGLRAEMAAGYRRFNRVSIARAAWALGQELSPNARVVIGFDGRHHSQECAQETASVLAGFGLKVYMFDSIVPTPLLAFSVVKLQAQAGVMITASHNPPRDNGFKVYVSEGQQIEPDMASRIEVSMSKAPLFTQMRRSTTWHLVSADVIDDYFRGIGQGAFHLLPSKNMRIVYTPMHGVGGLFALRALKEAGFDDVHIVESQAKPDGDFPTVQFPNPEEPGALDEAMKKAERISADVILANDPDADRLAVVAREQSGEWRVLNGNEIGILLGADVIENTRTAKQALVMSTMVSSQMLSKIAQANDIVYIETKTGFSKIANEALRREKNNGEQFVFGYEEALGYCIGTLVRDKDGISAAVRMAELCVYLRQKNQTVFERLDELYHRYGLFRNLQWSKRFDGLDALPRMKEWMKTLGEGELLTFYPSENVRLIIRPSGTEPKIKFYLEASEVLVLGDDIDVKKAELDAKLAKIRASY